MSTLSSAKKSLKYIQKLSSASTKGHSPFCQCPLCVIWSESTAAIEEILQAEKKQEKQKAEES